MNKAAPRVACVMLTKDRPAMAAQAIKNFQAQTYPLKELYILDTGDTDLRHYAPLMNDRRIHYTVERAGSSVGLLRNWINAWATFDASVVVHWDDDDYNHPNRIEEQVLLLCANPVDAVGYGSMLFWRTADAKHPIGSEPDTWDGGQTWLYMNHPRPEYVLGTSLCYWSRTWIRKPFQDLPKTKGSTGEDTEWLRGLIVKSAPSFVQNPPVGVMRALEAGADFNPRMIARIHGGNTSIYNLEEMVERSDSRQWHRVPQYDALVRGIMEAQ